MASAVKIPQRREDRYLDVTKTFHDELVPAVSPRTPSTPLSSLEVLSSEPVSSVTSEATSESNVSIDSGVPRHHFAIATNFDSHAEVYAMVAWTCERIFGKNPALKGTVQTYAVPEGQKFIDLAEKLDLVHGDVKERDELFEDLDRIDMFPEDHHGAMIDVVVLPTAETDLWYYQKGLLEKWDARPDDKKFQVVCIIHNGVDTHWFEHLREWTLRGVLRILTISEHVAEASRRTILDLADRKSQSKHYSALYEYIKWDVHYPVADMSAIIVPIEKRMRRGLTHALMQGNFQQSCRDYAGTFAELVQSLSEDAAAWGYLPRRGEEDVPYEPDPSSFIPPFKLHLAGMKGKLDIPVALGNIVQIHWQLLAGPFYELAQGMDVILPAFVEGPRYYDEVGSSTVHTAVQVHVPLLVTRRLLSSYRYLRAENHIVRPHALTEVQAIKALRTGRTPLGLSGVGGCPNPHLAQDVRGMVAKGWQRSTEGFERAKSELWARNEDVIWKVMKDL